MGSEIFTELKAAKAMRCKDSECILFHHFSSDLSANTFQNQIVFQTKENCETNSISYATFHSCSIKDIRTTETSKFYLFLNCR